MRVAFYIGRFSFRGTEQAIFDYADELEKQGLGEPYILHWERPELERPINDNLMQVWEQRAGGDARGKFAARFGERLLVYRTEEEMKAMLGRVDLVYLLVHGETKPGCAPAGELDLGALLAHLGNPQEFGGAEVAYHFVYEPSSAAPRTASISGAVARRLQCESQEKSPVVPHIMRSWPEVHPAPVLRKRMREFLGIPQSATVFGRLGGIDTFNIEPIVPVMFELLQHRDDVYFLFATAPMCLLLSPALCAHPCVIFVEPTFVDETRCALIDACDFMLHASANGETFGLAVLEFLSRGKPVLSFEPRQEEADKPDNAWSKYHRIHGKYFAEQHLVHLVGAPAGYYYPYWSSQSLGTLLLRLRKPEVQLDGVVFEDYTPARVMTAFKQHFLLDSTARRPG